MLNQVPQMDKQGKIIDKQIRAVEMRRSGMNFEEIARELDYGTAKGAQSAYEKGLRLFANDSTYDINNERHLEILRIEKMISSLWPKAMLGDAESVATILKCMERKARYTKDLEVPLPKQPHEIENLPDKFTLEIEETDTLKLKKLADKANVLETDIMEAQIVEAESVECQELENT